MEYKGYDKIDKIKIPKEALNAVEVDPDAEDAWTDDLDLEEEVPEEEAEIQIFVQMRTEIIFLQIMKEKRKL